MEKKSCKTCGITFKSDVLYKKHLISELHQINKAKVTAKPSSKLATSKVGKSPKLVPKVPKSPKASKSILKDRSRVTSRLDDTMDTSRTENSEVDSEQEYQSSHSQLSIIIKKLDALTDQIADLNERMDAVEDKQQEMQEAAEAQKRDQQIAEEDGEIRENAKEIQQIEVAEALIRRKLDAIRQSVADDLMKSKAQRGQAAGVGLSGMFQSGAQRRLCPECSHGLCESCGCAVNE